MGSRAVKAQRAGLPTPDSDCKAVSLLKLHKFVSILFLVGVVPSRVLWDVTLFDVPERGVLGRFVVAKDLDGCRRAQVGVGPGAQRPNDFLFRREFDGLDGD